MDSSSDSFEEIEESMLELVQRAEAFLSAFPSTSDAGSSSSSNNTSGTSFSSSSSSSSIDRNNSTRAVDDSLVTDSDESMSSIASSRDSSRAGRSVDHLSSSSIYSYSSAGSGHYSSANTSGQLDGNDSGSSGSTISSLQRTLSEDCILVPEAPAPFIDLCTTVQLPVQRASLIRRIADAAPILDSITLDDSIVEVVAPGSVEFRPPELPQSPLVVNEYRDGPPAKRSKEGAVLNLSQCSDGGDPEPAIALTCPICFDSIFTKLAASTICGHLYCHDCISKEVQMRKQCPLCKRKLARSHVHPIYCN